MPRRLLGNNAVPKCPKSVYAVRGRASVQPIGKPIRPSTHRGDSTGRLPSFLWMSRSARPPKPITASRARHRGWTDRTVALSASATIGVAQISDAFALFDASPACFAPSEVTLKLESEVAESLLCVGQILTASTRVVPLCITPVVVVCLAEFRESPTVAVGQAEDEDSLPSVGRARLPPL